MIRLVLAQSVEVHGITVARRSEAVAVQVKNSGNYRRKWRQITLAVGPLARPSPGNATRGLTIAFSFHQDPDCAFGEALRPRDGVGERHHVQRRAALNSKRR